MKKISFFEATDAPYYIYGLNFSQKSAGIRALHYLCHALNELGYEAYITCDVTNPSLRTPKLTKRIQRQHQEAGRTPVVIYPEVISGNPLAGKIVARWLLNQPGHLSGDRYFDDKDLIFTYSLAFLPPGMKGDVLHLPTIDSTIFNNEDNPHDASRDLVCYYANKYLAKDGLLTHHVQGATSLGQEVQLSHREIATILRRSKILYIYEPTALMNEALLCGCPVCVIVTDYWKNNAGNMTFAPDIGIAMEDTPEAIAIASQTVPNYASRFDKNVKWAWTQLRHFIKITQRHAKEFRQQKGPDVMAEMDHQTALMSQTRTAYSLWQAAHRDEVSTWMPLMKAVGQSGLRPIFHFIIPLPAGCEHLLTGTLDSLARQNYQCWQLSILSELAMPKEFENRTGIRWLKLKQSGYVNALNDLVKEGGFDWLLILEAGDTLEEHALSAIMTHVSRHLEVNIVYADEDTLGANGLSQKPFFKSDFSIDFFRSAHHIFGSGVAIKYDFLQGMAGFRYDCEGAEHYDLMLRAYEEGGEHGIGHIADVLYHRHVIHGDSTLTQDEVSSARRSVLQEHLARTGALADVEDGVLQGTFHIRYRHGGESAVTIIIPTLNGGAVLQSSVNAIVENTEFKNWELIVVDQESDDADTLAFLDYLRNFNNDAVCVISQPRSSSWPALRNAGARVARQDYLLFLSDSTQPLRNDWLDEMLGYAVQPGVGVVGAKAVGADGKVSNAGYILGLGGQPAGFHDLHVPLDDPGYFGRLQNPGNPSAVSSTCMLTKKGLFDELGGFDEQLLATGYSDVDYCLKVGKVGQRVVWTPFALMYQQHRTDPPKEIEVDDEDDDAKKQRSRILPGPTAQVMFDRWLDRIAFDPAYNRNLSLSLASRESYIKGFDIETLPALTWDPEFRPLPRILAFVGGGESREEHRIIAPMRALVSAAMIQGADTAELLSIPELTRISPDVLIFQHNQEGHQPKLIESYVRNSKAFRIFELDVFLSNTQLYQDNSLADTLNLSDRLVVPTEYLAHEYRKFSPEIHVVPDYIERSKWGSLTPQRMQGRKPRVGWAGSAIHEVDLAIISDVVNELHEEVEWVFFGLCPEGTRAMVEYHGGVVNSAYPSKLASLNLDLAISPLADIPYNHAESHLRLLEYGALGYPVICTDITPYRGAYPVTRIRNQSRDWIDAIREHVSDLDELARRGDALREYVNGNWMLEDNLGVWLKAWLPSQS